MALFKFVDCFFKKKKIDLYNNGDHIRDFTYIDDIINPIFILIALAKDTEKRPQREKEIKLMREKTGATFPIITDYNSEIFELFAEEKAGVTRSIIIDQNGEIAFLTRLFDHDEFNEMKTVIDKLLKKKR